MLFDPQTLLCSCFFDPQTLPQTLYFINQKTWQGELSWGTLLYIVFRICFFFEYKNPLFNYCLICFIMWSTFLLFFIFGSVMHHVWKGTSCIHLWKELRKELLLIIVCFCARGLDFRCFVDLSQVLVGWFLSCHLFNIIPLYLYRTSMRSDFFMR